MADTNAFNFSINPGLAASKLFLNEGSSIDLASALAMICCVRTFAASSTMFLSLKSF